MELAHVRIKTDRDGSDILVKNITPAELMLLVASYHAQAGGNPVKEIIPAKKTEWKKVQDREMDMNLRWVDRFELDQNAEDGRGAAIMVMARVETEEPLTISRTPMEEKQRLVAKYGKKKVNATFGSQPIPQIPVSFEQSVQAGVQLNLAGDRFSYLFGEGEGQ